MELFVKYVSIVFLNHVCLHVLLPLEPMGIIQEDCRPCYTFVLSIGHFGYFLTVGQPILEQGIGAPVGFPLISATLYLTNIDFSEQYTVCLC